LSVSFPAEPGQLTSAGAVPLPIQLANLMNGNTITHRKLTFYFSWKLIPNEFLNPARSAKDALNPRLMQLNQQVGFRLIFCRFKNLSNPTLAAYDPVNQLFDSYFINVPNPGTYDQGTAMVGSFIEGIRNVCTIWREKRFYLSMDKPYKEFKVSFKFPRGLQMTKKFDSTLGVYYNDSPISYFAIITTGQNTSSDTNIGALIDPLGAVNAMLMRYVYRVSLYQLYKYWFTDS
jgi:hypothetical protein